MGMGAKLKTEIIEWGVLTMVLVIICVILLKLGTVDGVTTELNTSITTIVAALQEPKNWLVIVIVGLIGFGLVKMFMSVSKK